MVAGLHGHALAMAGTDLSAAGRFHIASVPDGRYYLLSAALPLSADPLALLPESTWRVGSVEAPLLVHGGRAAGHVDLTRPPATPDRSAAGGCPALPADRTSAGEVPGVPIGSCRQRRNMKEVVLGHACYGADGSLERVRRNQS
jgi:hypothetical protein